MKFSSGYEDNQVILLLSDNFHGEYVEFRSLKT